MRTLVLLTDGFGGQGGIATFNRDLLHALCSHPRCIETIAVPRLMPAMPGPLPVRLRHLTQGLGGKWTYLRAVLRTAFRERDINLVVCGHINLLPLAWFAARRLRARLLLIVHGIEAWQPTRQPLTNRLARKVSAFWSVSEFTRQRFLGWTGLPEACGQVVPDCVVLEDFSPGSKPPHLLKRHGLQGRTVMMTLARLSASERYKGIDEVLEMLSELSTSVPSLSYVIAGEGTDRARLEAKVATLGLRDRVIFAGRITEEEKADYYRLADAFVMPGFGEGFGIVYLEAMASGIPVVASSADGSREAVKNGELGIVVNPRNREELKAGILRALQSPRGTVPPGLEYFSFENFQRRVHAGVDAVLNP